MIRKNSLLPSILCLCFILLNVKVLAQGGSNYSILGIGDINRNNSAFSSGMGGTSSAVTGFHNISLKNPATWSYIPNTRLQAGYRFNQQYVNSEENGIFQNNGGIEAINVNLALDTSQGLALGLGIFEYSTVNYLVASPFSYQNGPVSVSGNSRFQGRGGISAVYGGLSYKPTDYLALGAMIYTMFGSINTGTRTIFNEFYTYPSDTRLEESFLGTGIRLGAIVTPIKDLNLSLTYEQTGTINVESRLIYESTLNKDTTFPSSSNFSYPISIGAGFSYTIGKFIIAGDYSMQDFTNFDYRKSLSGNFGNSYQASLGLVRMGNTFAGSSYTDKITYLFGLGRQQLYFTLNDQVIDENYASLGLSMPMPGTGIFDMAISFGLRGTTNQALVQEYFARMNFNLSIGENWFVPFRKNY